MNWFDLVMVLSFFGVVWYESRREAGRALLDAVATLLAVHLAALYAPILTIQLNLPPLSGTSVSPIAEAASFGTLWLAGLGISYLLHRATRWSMDSLDPLFGFGFGLLIAITAGHAFTSTGAQIAMQAYGKLPECFVNSVIADELRNFHTYHYVMDVFHAYQGAYHGLK